MLDKVLFKHDHSITNVIGKPSVYYKKGELYTAVIDRYTDNYAYLYDETTDQYHYIHYSHCYSIEETVIKLRMLKIKNLRRRIKHGR